MFDLDEEVVVLLVSWERNLSYKHPIHLIRHYCVVADRNCHSSEYSANTAEYS